jgi:hypothetical protein
VELRRRWIALACFASWAVGPALGIALAAHELEHHGSGLHEHSHAAEVASALVHGHFHDDDGEDHEHSFAPPSSWVSRLTVQGDAPMPLVGSARQVLPASVVTHRLQLPEPAGLSPPSPFRLCALLL